MTRLKEKYQKEVVPALMKTFSYKNIMQVPRLHKIVLNMGIGEAIQTPKLLDAAVQELSLIAAQRPVVCKAKKSVSAFKLREGMSIGCKVTLRGERMEAFLDKLINIALPRIRDFRGLSSKSFDGRGNYSLGIRDHLIFPELEYDKVEKSRGLDITIVTTAKTDEEAREFLKLLGVPIKEN
ncbi:MAG TPA: 50S ribosomal protein L5 [Candidatus Eremiobacteraeota bacterium]|nr:MAG: 50S ribosomal protein L5 [bacterium ADurb.Bin363]HPZ08167.1 50S ribosomal protein L5 [Candidatus Eremiobacteraeota bacterium]